MKKSTCTILRSMLAIMLMAASVNAFAAKKEVEMTPEFIEEGISRCEAVMDKIATDLDELGTEEQDMQRMPYIINSIDFRNCRKKYGKIELTDEHRARLLKADLKVSNSLINWLQRAGAPFDVIQKAREEMTEENIKKDLEKNKTLRDYMQTDM